MAHAHGEHEEKRTEVLSRGVYGQQEVMEEQKGKDVHVAQSPTDWCPVNWGIIPTFPYSVINYEG